MVCDDPKKVDSQVFDAASNESNEIQKSTVIPTSSMVLLYGHFHIVYNHYYINMESPAFLSFALGSTLLAADVNLSSKKRNKIRTKQWFCSPP